MQEATKKKQGQHRVINHSTYDSAPNAATRREMMERFNANMRRVLVSKTRERHVQVGLIAVVENGTITAYQIIDTPTTLAPHLAQTA
jgi:hypothetical protein